jgi:hypothetical protein
MHFTISRPQKKRKAQPGGETASAAACAIGAFIGLHGQKKKHSKKLGFSWVKIKRLSEFKLKYDAEDRA